MKHHSELTACVVDSGLFLPVATRLARDYREVYYYKPVDSAFPTLNESVIGQGYDITPINEEGFWKKKDSFDLFVFPDIYRGGLQTELANQGKAVWGSRHADKLEIYRADFMKTISDLGLQVPKFQRVIGIGELRSYVRDREDLYIKVSRFRGTMETTHWRNWQMDEGWLDAMAVKLGPYKYELPFLVFDAIETDLEIGGDTYCIDGEFPKTMVNGLEAKDRGYLGAVTQADEMPDAIKEVLKAFAPVLRADNYRNAWSMEIRVKGDEAYFIDPTCRFPCPAGGAQMELYRNFGEIIWQGANGRLIEPDPTAAFAVECVLTSKPDKNGWRMLEFPEELHRWLKIGNSVLHDSLICIPPDDGHSEEIGFMVALGNTIEEAVDAMKAQAKLLPDGVHACTESLFELITEARSAEKQGIEFSDQQVPEPTVAAPEA